MKLIIQHSGGQLYIYRERERHFAKVERERSATHRRVAHRTLTELDNGCLIGEQLRTQQYVVVTL